MVLDPVVAQSLTGPPHKRASEDCLLQGTVNVSFLRYPQNPSFDFQIGKLLI